MKRKKTPASPPSMKEGRRKVTIATALTVKELANLLGLGPAEVIKKLMASSVMATINQLIDPDTATVVASDLGFEVQELKKTEEVEKYESTPSTAAIKPRPPVVTVMGHVDHGKTSLLDTIRKTNVAATERGGITQHIGAYQVEVTGKKITFLDTPGHEAFTAMRARGAQVTDIAIIVVAADDGVMPQTIEAINHARAAKTPIIVALNKIDKPEANQERVKKQLGEQGLLIEEWGGEIVCVPVSAKKGQGISELLENILLVAEIGELKADYEGPARGVIIEAKLDKAKGVLATALLQQGNLKVSNVIVAGDTFGKVKAMFNEAGKRMKIAEPSTPSVILGLSSLPQAGDSFRVMPDEHQARALLDKIQLEKKAKAAPTMKSISLDELFVKATEGKIKELNVILKTDVQGSVQPIKESMEKLSTEKIRVKVIHSAAGSITESDINLAYVSKGIVIGFNSRLETGAKRLAESLGVDIRNYDIIYNLVEDIRLALQGMLEPTYVETVEGYAEVIALFTVTKSGKIAGIRVNQGRVSRDALVRIHRQGKKIHEGEVASLRRFKDDVKECATGFECGIGIKDFVNFQVGDVMEFYRMQKSGQA